MGDFFIRWLKGMALLAVLVVALVLIIAGGAAFIAWSWQPAVWFLLRLDWGVVRVMFLLVVAMSGLMASVRW